MRNLYEYRTLILAFASRDIKVQYAQTWFGIFWIFVQAITSLFIINLFFGVLLNIRVFDIPYALFVYPGMIAWYYFSNIIRQSGTSLLQSQHLINKIYFPKLVLPLAKILSGLVEFGIWFIIYIILMIYYKYPVTINLVFFPIAVCLNIITGLSVSIWLSAITIRYRDAQHIIPYIIGFGMLVTPVFYTSAMVPEHYHFMIYLNPMAGVIAFMRWCLLGLEISFRYYLLGFIPVIILLISGLFYFNRKEGKIADIL